MTSLYYFIWIVSFSFFLLREIVKYKRLTPFGFMALLQLVSVISLYLSRPDFVIEGGQLGYAMVQFTGSIILALGLSKYSKVRSFIFLSARSERYARNLILGMCLVSLMLNIYLAYKSLSHFTTIEIGVSQFKNDKVAAKYLESLVPSYFYTAIAVTTPFAFFALLLHFYYLLQFRFQNSFLMLICALPIPLGALHELSRGRLILFMEIYLFLYFALGDVLDKKIKSTFRKLILLVNAPIIYALVFISTDRFDNFSNDSKGLVSNPVILSLLDYAGQWHENSIIVLERFRSELIMNGSRFGYFTRWVKDKLGYEIVDQFDRDIEVYGMLGTQFRGLMSNLVYDMGYVLTFIFVLSLNLLSGRYMSRNRSSMDMRGLMFYLGIVLFQCSFYQGNIVVLAFISFTYLYIFYFIHFGLKFRFR